MPATARCLSCCWCCAKMLSRLLTTLGCSSRARAHFIPLHPNQQQSTAALPFGTIVIILIIWGLVTMPLTIFGGIAGKNNKTDFAAPCRCVDVCCWGVGVFVLCWDVQCQLLV